MEQFGRRNFFSIFILVGPLLLYSVYIWPSLALDDNPLYFMFADQRARAGLVNFNDVISNILFLTVGIWGFRYVKNRAAVPDQLRTLGLCLGVALVLVSFGSTYFHLEPTRERLFWDRLPMCLTISTILGAIIADRVHLRWGLRLAGFFAVASVVTLILWRTGTVSLRPYLLFQYGCLVLMASALISSRRHHLRNGPLFAGLVMYLLAKATESYDVAVYIQTATAVSGHTLKHLLAAGALYFIFRSFPASAQNRSPDLGPN